MDPNACYIRWRDAILAEDFAEAKEAAEDLAMWLLRGGFEPEIWQREDIGQDLRVTFWEWCRRSEP